PPPKLSPRAPPDAGPSRDIDVLVEDAVGRSRSATDAPRWPFFVVVSERGLPSPIFLVSDEFDESLARDLSSPPFVGDGRIVMTRASRLEERSRLGTVRALDRGALLSIAIPAWAVFADGTHPAHAVIASFRV